MTTEELYIESYNQNRIYKLTQVILVNGFRKSVNIFYDAGAQQIVQSGDIRLAALTPDAFYIDCTSICKGGACHPDSLLSNLGDCLLANNGDFILRNGGA